MTSSSPDRGYSWDSLPKVEKLPRYLDAVGVRCARDGCSKTEGITFDKPLCYSHWKDFDAYLIFECQRCHWFDELVGEFTEDDLCYECVDRKRRGFSPTGLFSHASVSARSRRAPHSVPIHLETR